MGNRNWLDFSIGIWINLVFGWWLCMTWTITRDLIETYLVFVSGHRNRYDIRVGMEPALTSVLGSKKTFVYEGHRNWLGCRVVETCLFYLWGIDSILILWWGLMLTCSFCGRSKVVRISCRGIENEVISWWRSQFTWFQCWGRYLPDFVVGGLNNLDFSVRAKYLLRFCVCIAMGLNYLRARSKLSWFQLDFLCAGRRWLGLVSWWKLVMFSCRGIDIEFISEKMRKLPLFQEIGLTLACFSVGDQNYFDFKVLIQMDLVFLRGVEIWSVLVCGPKISWV